MRLAIAATSIVLACAAGGLAQDTAPAEGASTQPASLGEPPLWPIGLRLSDELVGERGAKKKDRPADVLVWMPPGAKHIRAMLLIPNNSDSKIFGEHAAFRKVAARQEIAVVYLRSFFSGIEYFHNPKMPNEQPPADPDRILRVLDLVADATAMPEFRHAPWFTFGKSSRGEFPFRMGWLFPKRTVGSISYHGETPTWPIPPWARLKDETILHLSVNGQEEWSGTWYRHVRPSLLNYHAKTSWRTHQAVVRGVGHGNYADSHGSGGWGKPVAEGAVSCLRVWDYIALYIDKAMDLRVPKGTYPTDGPTTLKQVDRDAGYLVHPRAPEELLGMKWMAFRYNDGAYQNIPWPQEVHPVLDPDPGTVDRALLVRRAADVPEAERAKLFWLPDREQAEAWLRLHGVEDMEGVLPPSPP